MKQVFFGLLLSFVLCTGFSNELQAAPVKYTFDGYVVDGNGNPLSGNVTIISGSEIIAEGAVVDGYFRLELEEGAELTIVVEVEGYIPEVYAVAINENCDHVFWMERFEYCERSSTYKPLFYRGNVIQLFSKQED